MEKYNSFFFLFLKLSLKSNSSHAKFALDQLPDNKILDYSKLKEIADDILKCL